jgi:ribosome-binding ATPase YchF (GTP1/OBG family)
MIYVFNVDDGDLTNDKLKAQLSQYVDPAPSLFMSAKLEYELNSLDQEDAQELLASYGQNSSSLDQLINTAYKTLGLQSFLTAGPKEVRAWTIKRGMTASQAAGVIHTDFERGFIAAEIVSYQDLVALGSLAAARSAGKIRTEGRSYIMQPNDVVEFRFNV